ncbi:hypothetical protein [Candidatus Entotheonella palauensis]|nr:hypothetical protein [Candidatus Entotheonella palauensis]
MATITLNLPDSTLAQAHQAAAILQRPVEEILSDMLSSVLPSVGDVPADIQMELTRMTWLDNEELWRIARDMMTPDAQMLMQQLIQLQTERSLTPVEQKQLEDLRQEYGRLTLLKARAYALLSLRGGQPLLSHI